MKFNLIEMFWMVLIIVILIFIMHFFTYNYIPQPKIKKINIQNNISEICINNFCVVNQTPKKVSVYEYKNPLTGENVIQIRNK